MKNMASKTKRGTVKYVLDCTSPVEDKVMDIASFETYLKQHIKVENKTGNLATNNVFITRDRTKISVASPVELKFSKRQLKYLSKRYLKKQQLRDYLRVIAASTNSEKQVADQQASEKSTAKKWSKYTDPSTNSIYFYCEDNGDWFYKNDKSRRSGWTQFLDESSNRHWWFNESK